MTKKLNERNSSSLIFLMPAVFGHFNQICHCWVIWYSILFLWRGGKCSQLLENFPRHASKGVLYNHVDTCTSLIHLDSLFEVKTAHCYSNQLLRWLLIFADFHVRMRIVSFVLPSFAKHGDGRTCEIDDSILDFFCFVLVLLVSEALFDTLYIM